MKKLINLFIAMLALCGISCEHQGEGVGDKTPTTFVIQVVDITTTTATVNVIPSNHSTYYYFDVVAQKQYNEYASPEAFANSRIASLEQWIKENNTTWAEMLVTGPGHSETTWLMGGTDYYAYAFGITADGKLCTDVAIEPFTTLPYSDTPSNNTFDIAVSDITAHGAKIDVTPSNEDYYYFYAVEKAELEEFASEEAFAASVAAKLKETSSSLMLSLSSGPESFVFNALLKPNTDYYAYAFGVSGNYIPTTHVTKVAFKTLEDVDNVTMLDYFVSGFVRKYENRYAEGTATWSMVLFAQSETNVLMLEVQTPNSATDFVGEYEISSSLAPGSVVAGSYVNNLFKGSYWTVSDNSYNLVDHKLFQSGSVKVSKTGDVYTLTVDALDQNNEKVKVSYTGLMAAI